MASTGSITIFTEQPSEPVGQLLLKVLGELGVREVSEAMRFVAWQWSDLQRLLAGEDVEVDEEWEYMNPAPAIADLPSLCDGRRCLAARVWPHPIIDAIAAEACGLPPDVIGSFRIDEMYLCAGPRDMFEDVDEPKFFGNARCAIRFCGPGSPLHWAAARELLVNLPSVRALAARLEPIIGPTKICAYWDG